MRAGNIFDAIKPYIYLSKVLGFANFQISPNGMCEVKFIDKVFILLNISIYNSMTIFVIFIQGESKFYDSRIQYFAKCSVFLSFLLIMQICVGVNFIMRRKFSRLFKLINDFDEKISNYHKIDLNFEQHKKMSLTYVAFTVGAQICIVALSTVIVKKIFNDKFLILHSYFLSYYSLTNSIYIGQFILTLLLIKSRFSILNRLLR